MTLDRAPNGAAPHSPGQSRHYVRVRKSTPWVYSSFKAENSSFKAKTPLRPLRMGKKRRSTFRKCLSAENTANFVKRETFPPLLISGSPRSIERGLVP